MHFAFARRKYNGVQPPPNEPQHLKSPLSVGFAGVFLHQRMGPVKLLDKLKRQTTACHIGGIFGWIESNLHHFIVCTLN